MRRENFNRFKRLQRVLLLFYVVMLIFPVLTCLTAYFQSLQFVIDREMESQTALARTGMEHAEASLRDADAYANSLMGMKQFESYLRTNGPQNVLASRMQTMLQNFPVFSDSNRIVTRSYIYSASSDSILDKLSGYLNLSLHYDRLFRIEGYDFDAWHDQILRDSRSWRYLSSAPDARGDYILYSRRISYGTRTGRILFYLDANRLLEVLNGYSPEDAPGFTALFDRDGKLLHTNAQGAVDDLFSRYAAFDGYIQIETEGEKTILSAVTLPAYGWTLYVAVPRAHFTQNALQMSLGIVQRLLPLLIVGTLLMAMLLWSSHRPIRQTITHLPEDLSTTLNPFKYVQQSVDFLSETNRRQEAQLMESRGELKEAILSSLIYQKQGKDSHLAEKLAEVGLHFESDAYRALILTLWEPGGSAMLPITDRMHMIVLEMGKEYEAEIKYLKMDAPEQMVFLALMEDTPRRFENLQQTLNRFCRDITLTLNCDARIYIGSECGNLNDVSHSFKSARYLISAHPVSEGYLICARDKAAAPAYDYSGEDEKRLLQLASIGNFDALCQSLDQLYERNSGVNARTPFEKQLLCARMVDTLIAAGYQEPLDEEIQRSLPDIPLEKFFQLLKQSYAALCQHNRSSEQAQQKHLALEILEAIHRHYADYEFSTAQLSLQFGLSDRRLSALIKEETGQGFAEYLEKVRMEHAMEMLRDSGKTIEEIALSVGYASDKSFRRAFKRCTGQSPSAFRI